MHVSCATSHGRQMIPICHARASPAAPSSTRAAFGSTWIKMTSRPSSCTATHTHGVDIYWHDEDMDPAPEIVCERKIVNVSLWEIAREREPARHQSLGRTIGALLRRTDFRVFAWTLLIGLLCFYGLCACNDIKHIFHCACNNAHDTRLESNVSTSTSSSCPCRPSSRHPCPFCRPCRRLASRARGRG